ncbi:MAG: response regulator [Chloroflexi bacterium]|nr:response regulator [Chloroflexota bacterium]
MTLIRILVVDDSVRMRKAICDVLRTVDACEIVGQTWNGLEAVELARALRPDLIVLDVHMPIMGGIDTLRRVKSELPQTNVVMVSSDLLPEVSDSASRLGAVACLEKGEALSNGLLAVVAGMSSGPLARPDRLCGATP